MNKLKKNIYLLLKYNLILVFIIIIIPIKDFRQIKAKVITILGTQIELEVENWDITADSNLRALSNLSAKQYDSMLSKTALNGLGNTLVRIEQEYHINGLYMLGLACIESSYGTSNIAKTKNNITGYMAYDYNTGKAKVFSSYDECLLVTAELLDKHYLTEGACYYNGNSARAVDINYCTDKKHADKIINIINKLKGEI